MHCLFAPELVLSRLTITCCAAQRDCGVHATAVDAARARDMEALKEGVKRLNFPLETYAEEESSPVRVVQPSRACHLYLRKHLPSEPSIIRREH